MEESVAAMELNFYTNLRNNKVIKEIKCEEQIREYIDVLFEYVKETNLASKSHYSKEKENYLANNIADSEEICKFDHLIEYVPLNFYDAGSIATAKGISKKLSGIFNPITELFKNSVKLNVSQFLERYDEGKKENKIDISIYDKETRDALDKISNIYNEDEYVEAFNHVQIKTAEYLTRELNLLKLSNNADFVKKYRKEKGNLTSLMMGDFYRISRELKYQSEMNKVAYLQLKSWSLMAEGLQDAFTTAEVEHYLFLQLFEKEGYLNIELEGN